MDDHILPHKMVVIGDEEADNPAVDEHDGSEQPTIDWTTFELDASYLPSDLSDDERKHSLKRLNASIRELQECAARLREAQDVYARACEVSKSVREQHARDTTVMRRELQHRLELMAASISSDPSADTSKQPHHRKDTGTRIQELQRLVNEMRFVLLHRLVEARQEPTLSEAQLVRDHQTRFNQINQSLREMASELGARLPWQLSYRLLQAQGHIPFEAGYITDAQGERINEAVCHLCALVLQAWSIGHGTPRYICLDSGRVYCVPCFRAASSIWAAIDSSSSPSSSLAASERLDSIEPHRSIASWMLEHDIPTFLRFPIGRADTLQTLLRCAFRQYAHRPAIAVPIVDHSAVTLVRRVQPESTASIAACSTDGVVWLTYHALERLVSPLAGWLRDTLSHEGSFKSVLMLGDGPTLWSLVVELAACQARVPLLHHSEQVLQQQGPLAALCSEHNVGLLVIRPSVLPQLLQHEFADDFRVALLLECLTHDEPIATASVAQFTFEHVLAAPESMELDNSNSSSSSNSNSLPPLNIYHTSFLEDGTVRFTSQNEYKWLRSLNQPNFELPLTYCFSDPLSNRSSRFGLWRTLCNGGRIAVTPIDVNVLQHLEARADAQALCEARLRLQMRRFDALYVALPSYCSPYVGHTPSHTRYDGGFSLTNRGNCRVSVHIPCGSFDEHKGSWYQAFQLKLVDPALSAAELMTQAVFPFARPCKLGTSKVIGDIVEPPDHEYHLNVDALNCWTFQNHMDCAAAAIAGAINTLYKRTRNNSLLCPNDISSLMKFMAEQQLLQSVAEFEASLRDFAAPLSLDDAHLAIEQLHRAIVRPEQTAFDRECIPSTHACVRSSCCLERALGVRAGPPGRGHGVQSHVDRTTARIGISLDHARRPQARALVTDGTLLVAAATQAPA